MYFGSVFDVVKLLSSFKQWWAMWPMGLLIIFKFFLLINVYRYARHDNSILLFILNFKLFYFREWNGVEVDCIIKMKKITGITDNNFYILFIDIMKLQLLCAINLGKGNLFSVLCVYLLKRTNPLWLLESFKYFWNYM